MIELTEKARRKIERGFELKREACELLRVIAAEFKTDPTSVQCFDLRIVRRAIEVSDELNTGGHLL